MPPAIHSIQVPSARSATEPTTHMAGNILRRGPKPYFAPRGVYDYAAAAKKMGPPSSFHAVPQFPKQNKAYSGGAATLPIHGKNRFSPYVSLLNEQSKNDFENLLAIQAPFNDEAKMLLQREFAERNRMTELLEVESLMLQGLSEDEAKKYQHDSLVKRVLENPMKHNIRKHLDRQNLIHDFAKFRGYTLPNTIVTPSGIQPVDINFTGKDELTVRRLAKIFLSEKEAFAQKTKASTMWGKQHTENQVFPTNAQGSSSRYGSQVDVNGTNDRGGLSYGNLPESEKMMGKVSKFASDTATMEWLARHSKQSSEAQYLANEVDQIVESSLNSRFDALQVAAPSTEHHGHATQHVTGGTVGGGAGAGPRHSRPKIPTSREEFFNMLERQGSKDTKRVLVSKLEKEMLSPEEQKELFRKSWKDKRDYIADKLPGK